MSAKTSQLQIRVTEEQKATLRRLARLAGMTVSSYVLAQALPSDARRLDRVLESLIGGGDPSATLADLAVLLWETPPEELAESLASPPLEQLTPLVANQLAAVAEHVAHARAVSPPGWVESVRPLVKPHFAWALSSLRPHQIRVTPLAFKRRNIFFDPASRPALEPPAGRLGRAPPSRGDLPEALSRLMILNDDLRLLELDVEFYFLGGAILRQAFRARPATAHVGALFEPQSRLSTAVEDAGRRHGWPDGWLERAVKEQLSEGLRGHRYLELSNLAALLPPLEYVLALFVARLRLGREGGAAEDLRYVARALNVRSAETALDVVGRYFGPRQLPEDVGETLRHLLAA